MSMRVSLHIKVLGLFIALSFSFLQAQVDHGDMASSMEEALTFTKYPTYKQYLDIMRGFAEDYPEICRLDTFGVSKEGRLLLVVKISDRVEEEEAEADVLLTSTMHGDELLGYVLGIRLIHTLLSGYGENAWTTGLVDSLAIWINPLANPDGSYAGGDQSLAGATRENAGGHDLNRSFPDISNGEADEEEGRPLENQHMMRFLRERRFTLSANIHGGYEVLNYPWDWSYDRHPDDAWFRFISREYADEAHEVDPTYLMMEDEGITHGADWYQIQGSRQDYVTYYLGGREVTLELSFDKELSADSLEVYWQKNHHSLLYYLTQATYGIRGRVVDASTGEPLEAEVQVLDHDDASSVVKSGSLHGDFYRTIQEGTYDLLFSSVGYEDLKISQVNVQNYDATYLHIGLQSSLNTFEALRPELSIRVMPNPATTELQLFVCEKETSSFRYVLCSSSGQVLLQGQHASVGEPCTIPTKQLSPGYYIIKVITGKYTGSITFLKN